MVGGRARPFAKESEPGRIALMDNFEWMSGFGPKFGLVAVDLTTQKRTIKPSAAVLGNIARRNTL